MAIIYGIIKSTCFGCVDAVVQAAVTGRSTSRIGGVSVPYGLISGGIMKVILSLFALLCVVSGAAPASAQDTVVDVSYSHRQIPNGEPPDQPEPWIVEGSVIATFSANNPIDLDTPDPTMVRIDARTFEHTFVWDWAGPKTVTFVDGAEIPVVVTAWPQPVLPFDPAVHDCPVVHIQTDSTSLWDPETGLYVWGNHANFDQRGEDWERPAVMDFYDASGVLQFSESIGLRINGQSSRWEDQKPLRFYFDGYGTSDQVVYDFFGGTPASFERLLARNGRYEDKMLGSNWAEAVFRDLGNLGSRGVFTAFYINGEYWGGYTLKERYDSKFVEHTHDLAADDYVLVKDDEPVHGDINEWYAFHASFSAPADYGSHAWFADKANRVDLVNYIDWLFINIFATSADNGLWWNVAQLKVGDGKWRYLMWDQDDVMYPENLNANYFRFYSAADEDEFWDWLPPTWWAHGWWEDTTPWYLMFNHLMHNSEFKALFKARVEELLAGPMSVSALIAQVDALVAEQQSEMARHESRWSDFDAEWYLEQAEIYRQFITDRHPIVTAQLADFMEHHRVPVELSAFSADGGDGRVDIVWRTESEEDNQGFVLYRSTGDPDAMAEVASYLTDPELVGQGTTSTPTGYVFTDDTVVNGQAYHYELHHVGIHSGETVHAWVEPAWPTGGGGLVVNEILAGNDNTVADEYGQYDDWFELHNGGDTAVSLDGLYVTDDLAQPTKHLLGGGLSIPPGGHLLLWADNETVQGPRHCAFKLSGSGEMLGLFAADGVTPIDTVTFGPQFDDHGYARYPDGGDWSYAWYASPEAPNGPYRHDLFLRINEVLADNVSIVSDEGDDYDPWLEIHNPLPVSVDMLGLALSEDALDPLAWSFPDVAIDPEGFLLVWGDDQSGQGPLHADFWLDAGGGFVGLYSSDGPSLIHSVTYAAQAPDTALALIPDGSSIWMVTGNPTPGAANESSDAPFVLYINEFLAANQAANQDEAGEYDDWCELYNPGPAAVQMGGLYLTDDLGNTTKWAFPDTVLPADGFLLVWCDEDPLDGPLHTNFKLGAGGEMIGLFGRLADGNPPLDIHVFGSQTDDVSSGRYPDGASVWQSFTTPTPGASNTTGVGVDEGPAGGRTRVALYPAHPNPASGSTILRFELPGDGATPVSLEVFDLRGRRVRRLVRDDVSPGPHVVTWDRRDDRGQLAAAGTYFCRLVAREQHVTQKILLMK